MKHRIFEMVESDSTPVISLCLVAYNQESFVREAVENAFAQDYPVLEILLSDDGSSDATFEVMREMTGLYSGPHKIILNRNERNLGIGLHVNRMVELTSGDLIVCSAGDDISTRGRVSALCEEWLRQGRIPTSIQSDFEVIDEQSRPMVENQNRNFFTGKWSGDTCDIIGFLRGTHRSSRMLGATHAFSREMFEKFGGLNADVVFEDIVIGFRSLIAGSFAFVPRKLVRYRMHSNNIYGRAANDHKSGLERRRESFAHIGVKAQRWAAAVNNMRMDAETAIRLGHLTREDGEIVLREIERCHQIRMCEHQIYAGKPGIGLASLCKRLLLRPDCGFGWRAAKHWLFRAVDSTGLLPKG